MCAGSWEVPHEDVPNIFLMGRSPRVFLNLFGPQGPPLAYPFVDLKKIYKESISGETEGEMTSGARKMAPETAVMDKGMPTNCISPPPNSFSLHFEKNFLGESAFVSDAQAARRVL